MKLAALSTLSAVFAWTVFRSAGVDLRDWNATVVVVVILAFLLLRRSTAPRMGGWLAWPVLLLPVWVLFELIPLPPPVIRILSPARAELAAALGGSHWIPLSAFPAMTLAGWQHLAGCVLVFLIVRELAWRYSDRRTSWAVIVPVVVIALLEAVLGLVQVYTGSAPGGAHGTYHNHNHFAGLMEMALPFPVAYGWYIMRRGHRRFDSPLGPALTACGSFAVAMILLLAAVHSLSRMGFIASLFAIAVLVAAAAPNKRWLLAVPAALTVLLVCLPPDELITRFAALSGADKLTSMDRIKTWRESVPLLKAYPAGCGLETFQFVFPRYKRHAPTIIDNYAHNDYLQYLAELGLPGFALGMVLVGGILGTGTRIASRHPSGSSRALALASVASICALLVHSVADFNTYIPANALAISWIAAVAISAGFSPGPQGTGTVQYVVLEADLAG